MRDGIVGDGIDESDLEGAGGVHFFGGDEEFQRNSPPDQARQALRSTPAGHQTEGRAAVSEHGMLRSDPPVTSGVGWSRSSSRAVVRASTQARVSRLVPSAEVRRRVRAGAVDSTLKNGEDTGSEYDR